MATIDHGQSDVRLRQPTFGPQVTFAASMLALFAALIVATQMLARDLVFSLVATALFLLACAISLIAWRLRTRTDHDGLTYWDVAGALTFIGICVAALIDPEQLVRLVASTHHEN